MSRSLYIAISIFCFLLCINSNQLHAQNKAEVRTDETQYTIGDYIRVSIHAQSKPNTLIVLPDAEALAPGFDIISSGPVDTLKTDSLLKVSRDIIYSLYDSGDYVIPSAAFLFSSSSGAADTLITDSIQIRIRTIPVDTTAAIKPIKENVAVSYSDKRWIYFLLGGIALLALILWGIITWRKKKQKQATKVVLVQTTLSAFSLAQLQVLEDKKLWENDRVKEYYIELTDIIRNYLEQRFHIMAMESTSDEIKELLEEKNPHLAALLPDIFFPADLAKFARSRPLPNQNMQALAACRDIIHASTPAEDPIIEMEEI